MFMEKRLPLHAAALLCSIIAAPLPGQTPIKDPMIPHGESAVYTVTEGEAHYTYAEEVSAIKESTRSVYGFTYKTDNETIEVRVERPAMIPFSIHTVTTGNGISIESSTLVSLDRELRSNGILVLSFSDLKYTLRGFPFDEELEDIGIEFINTGEGDEESSSAFSVAVRYREIEKVSVNGRSIDCHKLELKMSGSGIMMVLKPFIPKTYFWYSVESPHYLVAYEGSSGFPGSAKQRVEILYYSGWN